MGVQLLLAPVVVAGRRRNTIRTKGRRTGPGKMLLDEQLVSGRELHKFLGVKTQYSKWFERMAEYGFTENIDF